MLTCDLRDLPASYRGGAVAVGNFDGVHLGHARIVERLKAMARQLGGPAVVFTFEPHPLRLLRPAAAPLPLSTPERKAELLAELGVDATVTFRTDERLLGMTAHEFFDRMVCHGLQARGLVEGPDFRFGHGREGDTTLLARFCDEAGLRLEIVPPVEYDGQVVSSSRVRSAVVAGRIAEARQLLTRPYGVEGIVVRGAARGRKLGFPTANVARIPTLLPSEGIYAGKALADGRPWPAAISVGGNPTFGEGALKVEAYLIGFEGDLYDRPLAIDFLARLRDIVRFDSAGALVAQMERDVARTRQIVAV